MAIRRPPRTASKVTFEEFTEVTLGAVLRALEARKLPRGPIIIGIIYDPALAGRFGSAGGAVRTE